MANFSAITLRKRKREIDNTRRLLMSSKALLSDQTGEYAKHHIHVIDTLKEQSEVVGRAIVQSVALWGEG